MMNLLFDSTKWIFVLAISLFAASCGTQSETIVVNENPEATAADTTASNLSPANQSDFKKITIGTLDDLGLLDPLFADNLTTMQALQLVYEGLVRFDALGEIVPALAKRWSVSEDGKTYIFHLRSDVYYQDSHTFSSGKGRKFTADDVQFVFKRMADANVPPTAAGMFMDIQGFEPYYNEQHHVFNPANRQLNNISGITAPNDSTVRFTLTKSDDHFLKKLATPLALIYPRESVGSTVQSFTPIGTGPFVFSQKTNGSTYIFPKNKGYYNASQVNLNRIDVKVASSEKSLMKSLQSADIQAVTQFGPGMMQDMLNDKGELSADFSNNYRLERAGGSITHKLSYNSDSQLTAAEASRLAQLMHDQAGSFADQFPDDLVKAIPLHTKIKMQPSAKLPAIIYTTYAGSPFEEHFLGDINQRFSGQFSLKMTKMRTPNTNTDLFFTQKLPLIGNVAEGSLLTLYSFQVAHLALQRSEISELQLNQYPWWLNLRDTDVAADVNFN